MRLWRIAIVGVLVAAAFCIEGLAAPFVVFPKAAELASPDGRYSVRNAEREGSPSDFVGTFHSLWLIDVANGRPRKLCDYTGVAAVAWSGNQFIIVTQYSRRTSRALVFPVANFDDPVMLDASTLIRLLSEERRPALRENDHVFVEASSVDENKLYLRVWGYGHHDANGFRWRCEYLLREGSVACGDSPAIH